MDVSQSGTVVVYPITKDTNSPYGERNGASASVGYIMSNLVLQDLSYNVYEYGNNVDQNMNLVWNNPTSDITGWSVDKYDIYRTIVNNTNTNYDNFTDRRLIKTLNSTSYAYDASSHNCGSILTFDVVATVTNATVSYEIFSNSKSLEMFRYASAPRSLILSNIMYNNSKVDMSVNFTEPEDPGCGDPYQFAIEIGDNFSYTVSYEKTRNEYSISLTGMDVSQSGTVLVYPITKDTNSPYGERNGASTSVNYIASNLVLQDLSYNVYTYGNVDQRMNLVWNNPTLAGGISGWSVDNYKIYRKIDSSSRVLINTLNSGNSIPTTYAYDASSHACKNALTFDVVATVKDANTTVSYEIFSNDQSLNIFRYATEPQSVDVLWSVASDASTNPTMDIRGQFSNPKSIGCGTVQNFKVDILNNSDNVLYTQNVTHVPDATSPYIVNFNDISYSLGGNMKVYLITTDTNSDTSLNGISATATYISSRRPVYVDASINNARDRIEFKALTYAPLDLHAFGIYNDASSVVGNLWTTDGITSYVDVSQTTLQTNGEIQYHVTMRPEFLRGGDKTTFPNPFGITVSNNVGSSLLSFGLEGVSKE